MKIKYLSKLIVAGFALINVFRLDASGHTGTIPGNSPLITYEGRTLVVKFCALSEAKRL
jgi:hypothetical protein